MAMSMSDLNSEPEFGGPTFASGWPVDYLQQLDVPMIQGIISTGTEADWQDSSSPSNSNGASPQRNSRRASSE